MNPRSRPNIPNPQNAVLKNVSVGTEMHITQENLPSAIPVEACYLGWRDSLDKLAKLVEPEIPDDVPLNE